MSKVCMPDVTASKLDDLNATFNLGKIAFYGKNRVNKVTIDLEVRHCGGEQKYTVDPKTKEKTIVGTTPRYAELSICGNIWNSHESDIVCGGQCLDTIKEYRNQLQYKEAFDVLYDLWKNYHLNGMHAGTPEQETAIEEWKAQGNTYDYVAACQMLKEKGLYEVNYTGMAVGRRYNNEPYKYGHGWLVRELPEEAYEKIEMLLNC